MDLAADRPLDACFSVLAAVNNVTVCTRLVPVPAVGSGCGLLGTGLPGAGDSVSVLRSRRAVFLAAAPSRAPAAARGAPVSPQPSWSRRRGREVGPHRGSHVRFPGAE